MKRSDLRRMIREEVVKAKINEGFNYDPSIDYLERYDLLPPKVRKFITNLPEDECQSVKGRRNVVKQLERMGWTIEYDFTPDGLWGLRPIGTDNDYM
jgi:hypothetical protein